MDQNYMASCGLHDMLKCSKCDQYLSPSVYQCTANHLLCKKCSTSSETCAICEALILKDATIIELVANSLQSPCKYAHEGCDSKIPYNDLENHEQECDYKPYECPVASCDIKIPYPNLKNHFSNDHQQLYQEAIEGDIKISLNLSNSYYKILCISAFNHTFLLHLNRNDNTDFYTAITLQYVGMQHEADDFSYRIQFKDRDNNLSLQGRVDFYQNNSSSTQTKVKIMDSYMRGKKETIWCLSIRRKIGENRISDDLLKTIKCPICFQYMSAPVIVCKCGHSVCHECHQKSTVCSLCEREFTPLQNHVLEEISSNVIKPCAYNKRGCLEVGLVAEIHVHELQCRYGDFDCFECDWKGKLDDMVQHTEEEHSISVSDGKTLWESFLDESGTFKKLIVDSYGKPFVVCCEKDLDNGLFHFVVQAFCESRNYCFSLTLNDEDDGDRSVSFREWCNDYKLPLEDIIDAGNACSMTADRIKTFLKENGSLLANFNIHLATKN